MKFVWYNGELTASEKIIITPDNRGLLYGDGLFESIRCSNGKPLFIDLHFERLTYGLDVLKIQMPLLSADYLTEQMILLNKKNNFQNGVKTRIVITRNAGGTYTPENNSATTLITALPLPDNHFVWNENGLQVDVFTEIKKPINKLSSFKSCNSLLYVLASVDFKSKNFDDCLILNERNEICEGASSNIFWIKNNTVFTTPLSSGCVNGVLRTVLSGLTQVHEKTLWENELLQADEVFLTNMGSGIRWVKKFKNKNFTCRQSREILNLLNIKTQ